MKTRKAKGKEGGPKVMKAAGGGSCHQRKAAGAGDGVSVSVSLSVCSLEHLPGTDSRLLPESKQRKRGKMSTSSLTSSIPSTPSRTASMSPWHTRGRYQLHTSRSYLPIGRRQV